MSQTQVVVDLGKTYVKPQGQMTLWLQGQIYIFQQMKLGTSVILFHVFLTWQSISDFFFIQVDFQDKKKVNFKDK